MTNRSIAALLAATVATVVAAVAVAAPWPTRSLILSGWSAITTWILVAVLTATDRLAGQIEAATLRMERVVDDSHADGIVEGMRRAAPPTPGLRGIH